MGLRDELRRLREAADETKEAGLSGGARVRLAQQIVERQKYSEVRARWAPYFSHLAEPCTAHLTEKSAKRAGLDLEHLALMYLRIVGIAPADVYGFFPVSVESSRREVAVVYQDRPEYAAGRDRFTRALTELT